MSSNVSFLLLTSCQTQDILLFHNPSLVIPGDLYIAVPTASRNFWDLQNCLKYTSEWLARNAIYLQ